MILRCENKCSGERLLQRWPCGDVHVCNFESACSVGAASVTVPLPHGGDSVCADEKHMYMVPFLCVCPTVFYGSPG